MAQDETVAALTQQWALSEPESASRELVHSACSEELSTKPYDSLHEAGHSNNARLANDAFFVGTVMVGNLAHTAQRCNTCIHSAVK